MMRPTVEQPLPQASLWSAAICTPLPSMANDSSSVATKGLLTRTAPGTAAATFDGQGGLIAAILAGDRARVERSIDSGTTWLAG
jgi:hypothetical protein